MFFSCDLQVWLKKNGSSNPSRARFHQWPWTRIFSHACWLIWKAHCKQLFSEGIPSSLEVQQQCLFHLMEEVTMGTLSHKLLQHNHERSWTPPKEGEVRLDVDASIRQYSQATCDGVIRDATGEWIMGFEKALGAYPVSTAEILAIKTGLEVCKGLHISDIHVYSDSLEAINMLIKDSRTNHPFKEEIEETRKLLYEEWNVIISHANRENIHCADSMTRTVQVASQDVILYPEIPAWCREGFWRDKRTMAGG
ncbi:uncharacterized protein LOC114728031 [Neltuma alba]|uniref:uncharacterized protein LOC114728031 n=1 Tax=Neltuma alba TaxID=207710 RepID=UPI0010A3FA16|nr:uncharacterized protein LOC114728031 [Prosopis alba]